MKKAIVFQTAYLGDLALSFHFVNYLKEQALFDEVDLVCRDSFVDFANEVGLFANVYPITKKNTMSYWRASKKITSSYDQSFVLQNSLRSMLLSLSVITEKRAGFRNYFNSILFDFTSSRSEGTHFVAEHFKLLHNKSDPSALSSNLNSLDSSYFFQPQVHQQVQSSILEKFGLSLGFKVFAPGSARATKRWNLKKLSSFLSTTQNKFVILGGNKESKLFSSVINPQLGHINLLGKTSIYEAFVLIYCSRFLMGFDSGLGHLASFAPIPTLSLFGPTHTNLGFTPWSPMNQVIEKPKLSCRPCSNRGGKSCPIGHQVCLDFETHLIDQKINEVLS